MNKNNIIKYAYIIAERIRPLKIRIKSNRNAGRYLDIDIDNLLFNHLVTFAYTYNVLM